MITMQDPMDAAELAGVFTVLRRWRAAEWGRYSVIRAYMQNLGLGDSAGPVGDIYIPSEATVEYRMLVDQARFNICPLVVSAVAQNLFVDGYRPTTESGLPDSRDADIWRDVWQANRMDAQQGGLFRSAVAYGASYMTVLPGDGSPVPKLKPWSALRMTTLYEDNCDEWPEYAMSTEQPDDLVYRRPEGGLVEDGSGGQVGGQKVKIYDPYYIYTFDYSKQEPGEINGFEVEAHGLGVTPVVRFADKIDLDGDNFGKVWPILPVQRQINQTTFSLLMTQQYSSFRQRWATGMAIELNDDGTPVAPFNSAINSVWQNESPDAKFGDFAETNLQGYLESRDKALLHIASVCQVPPHNLLVGSGISNISADALAAIESGHRRDVIEHQTVFGEAIEQVLRLAGLAMGDMATWEDTSAQVVWQDTTPRSFAQIADALGKLAASLDIPVQALWERLPGVTDEDIARWAAMRDERDVMAELSALAGEGVEDADTGSDGGDGVDAAANNADLAVG